MNRTPPLAALLAAAVLTLAAAGHGQGQPPPPAVTTVEVPIDEQEPRFRSGEYVGPATCATANCHGRTSPSGETAVLQNEFTTWVHEDVHARAHESLFGERAQAIARNLGLEGSAAEHSVCLSCHALSVPPRLQARRLDAADGVSCEACHGAAGGWVDRHAEEGWTRARSLDEGMIDVRDPARRAEVCLGCHLGAGERDVGHELLAAGHPELVFELDNFGASMPAHWRPFAATRDGAVAASRYPARVWAVGQAESFRAGLARLAGRAGAGRWPEFGEMQCDSCHHSLAERRWRQARATGTRPGLPPWSPARWAVLRHLVAAYAPDARPVLDREISRLAAAVAELGTPPARIQEAATAAEATLRAAIPGIAAAPWDATEVRRTMAAIAGDLDYLRRSDRQSAEQAALALQSLAAALAAAEPETGPPLRTALDRIFDELEDPYAYRPDRFVASLGQLAEQVRAANP